MSYLPQRPDRARIMSGAGQQGGKWVLLVVGLACAIGAVAVAVH